MVSRDKLKFRNIAILGGEIFEVGDIIDVEVAKFGRRGITPKEFQGRIASIGAAGLKLDTSSRYSATTKEIPWDDFYSVDNRKIDYALQRTVATFEGTEVQLHDIIEIVLKNRRAYKGRILQSGTGELILDTSQKYSKSTTKVDWENVAEVSIIKKYEYTPKVRK